MVLILPWPPTINHCHIFRRGRKILTDKANDFIWEVKTLIPKGHKALTGKIKIMIHAYPPDKRKRDIDNVIKILQDALERGGVFVNDNQVCDLHILRCEVEKPGRVEVTIEEI